MSVVFCLVAGATNVGHAQVLPQQNPAQNGTAANSNQHINDGQPRPSNSDDTAPVRVRRSKPKPDPYSIYGYDDGVLQLRATMDIGQTVTSNVLRSSQAPQFGVGLELRPTISFATNWPVHQWTGSLSSDWVTYLGQPNADTLTGNAQTSYRLDIRRETFAEFSASAKVVETQPGQINLTTNSAGPRRDWTFAAGSRLSHDFGPWQGEASVGVTRASFGDVRSTAGAVLSSADLNYVEPRLALRGTLGSPRDALRPYVGMTLDPRFHDLATDANGTQRNSLGGSVAVGVAFDDGPIWQGDVSAVGLLRHYADPGLPLGFAVGLNGNLNWSPTRLWTLSANSTVALNESTTAGVAAIPRWNLGFNASYALRDNITLRAGNTYSLARNGSGADFTAGFEAGADWMLNPHFGLGGTLASTWFLSSTADSNYNEQRASVNMILRP